MNKKTLSLLAIAGIFMLNSCAITIKGERGKPGENGKLASTAKDEGINLSYMDTSVRPQDDFYD